MAGIGLPITFPDDFLGEQAAAFELGAQKLKDVLDKALEDLKKDASDPGLLAAYQTAFSSYTVFRNAQTNTIKGFKDIDMAIIQAAR
ncbi:MULTISPECIES: type III secretion system needle filament subunit SctF [unclassified Pseudomonas]|uniref:type III secretion system needle filament subunit SctF n=1 Tax=unclassified Pseudomonas TaxID=196821 RepID=UPI000885CE13|nr:MULTISPECIES: type III secretion system needle filament subunit SctF [unclassified Pseudomonas]SDB05575.1 type III secretion system major needle protein, YscF/MxiH/PrgI family [Pseudomonas sp. NFACC17-2]SDX26896.1 type III secretion system major needle protein, YscF/MxiH/PrgI family [Pseudomonas sp. NFACC08-1]SEI99294.1 type III secretion system major needle protein, YscF/MxiH/PrgI family [Pseudomonas sp. NFACC23-1]SFL57788.1 type III secretion system major needle protein, YscF/MxiH/PrgI fam